MKMVNALFPKHKAKYLWRSLWIALNLTLNEHIGILKDLILVTNLIFIVDTESPFIRNSQFEFSG